MSNAGWLYGAIAVGAGLVLLAVRKSGPVPDQPTNPTSGNEAIVSKLAIAIATAEGYYVPGSRGARNNNPGNITMDLAGGGPAIGRDGIFMVYRTADDGWSDLKTQIRLMFKGSRIYNAGMSLMEVATHYTTTAQVEWASIVARSMGTTRETRLSELDT